MSIVNHQKRKTVYIHIPVMMLFKGDGNPDDYYVLYERS